MQVTATVTGDPTNKGVAWTLSCSTAPCGGIAPSSTASGVATTYTAPGPPAGDLQVTLTATSVANSLATASIAITVPAISVDVEPTGVKVTAQSTTQFTATLGNDPGNKGVTWAVSCSATDCGTVMPTSTASGTATTYTAPNAPPPTDLTVTLIATSVTDTTKSTSVAVTVRAIVVNAISPPSGIIPVNASQEFSATVSYDPSNSGLNWTLTQNGSNCSPACGTVSPASTASGTPTTFTGPAALPANVTVTINAVAAADTTKIASATITLTKGTVKLIPASLDFHCKIKPQNHCPPPTQAIVLTNTDSAALTINSIATSGTDATLFTQTNDCDGSVAAGTSCSVTVTFKPKAVGSYSASVSFADSSADSPQQVALSGKATNGNTKNQAAALSDLAGIASAAVPAPTGTSLVGTRTMHLTDVKREDPYLNNGAKRELAVRFWYPASLRPEQKCVPAAYASVAVWNYFGQLVGVRPFPVTTNSCADAPVAEGAHPVVVFTPGFTATFTDYTYLTEDLASRGYVVAAVAHTYETTAVELGNGQLAKSVVGSHLGGPMTGDEKAMSTAVYTRTLDLDYVVSEIERLNSRSDSVFVKKLDVSRIAVAGHSLGALTALVASEFEPRFKAAILLDGFVPTALPSATKKPVLILGAGRERWEPSECRLWTNLEGARLAVDLRGTEHPAIGDWIWLTKDSVETGPMGPEKTMAAVRDYVATFLDAHLRGVELEPSQQRLLNGEVSEYPDAAVTTERQPLCAKQ